METIKRKLKGNVKSKEQSDIFLKKHVGLIHCENKLTLIQRKICNILLFNALDKINDQDIHEISLRQLCSLVGYNSNDIKLIKEAIKSLISVVMEWNLLEDSKFLNEENYPEEAITWNASSLLAGASIKAGIIKYSYSPQIKSVLSSLDIYGRINLFVQAKFNSTYSLVLYENCVRFKNIKQTSWFPIELFRSLMGVTGDKYASFKEFKRNVINVAVKELNQKSDISIEPQFKKSGRNITAIQFLISENKNYAPTFRKNRQPSEDSIPQQSVLLETLLSEFCLSEKQAHEILSAYKTDYIHEKVKLVNTKKNITHSGAYLISALKKDYKNENPKKVKIDKSIEAPSHLRESKEASEIRSLKNQYMAYKLKAYWKCVQLQLDDYQNEIKQQFEEYLRPKPELFRFYKKGKLESPFVRGEFIQFIDHHFPDILNAVLSFDEYITSEEHELELEY